MTSFVLLASATAAMPTRLDPVELFLDADIVVKAVMVGLLLASLWTWAIIVGFWLRMGRLGRRTATYEEDFWQAEDFDAFARAKGNGDLPPGRVAQRHQAPERAAAIRPGGSQPVGRCPGRARRRSENGTRRDERECECDERSACEWRHVRSAAMGVNRSVLHVSRGGPRPQAARELRRSRRCGPSALFL